MAQIAPALLERLAASGQPMPLAPEAVQCLEGHAWPANVRDLRNVLERASALAAGTRIEAGDIEFEEAAAPPTADDPVQQTFQDALDGEPYGGTVLEFRNRHGEEALTDLLIRSIRWTADVNAAGKLLASSLTRARSASRTT